MQRTRGESNALHAEITDVVSSSKFKIPTCGDHRVDSNKHAAANSKSQAVHLPELNDMRHH